jgi:nucleoid DNA-binding protein
VPAPSVVDRFEPVHGRRPRERASEIVITRRRVLTFKASQVLRKTMNDSMTGPDEG